MQYDRNFLINRARFVKWAEKMKKDRARAEEGLPPSYEAPTLERSFVKIIKSGHVVETYEYQKPVFLGRKAEGKRGGRIAGDHVSARSEENRKLTTRRARNMIRRLVNSNFTNRMKFVTLTFADPRAPDGDDPEARTTDGTQTNGTPGVVEGRTQEGTAEGGSISRGSQGGPDDRRLCGSPENANASGLLSGRTSAGAFGGLDAPPSREETHRGSQGAAPDRTTGKTSEETTPGGSSASEGSPRPGGRTQAGRTRTIDIRDVTQTNPEFKKFIQRLRRHVAKLGYEEKFPYVAVIEFQGRNRGGVVHYHMIADLPYIPNQTLNELWGNGFVRINRIEGIDNVGAYITKYMMKDVTDTRLQGHKCYLPSKGLKRPEVISGELAHVEIQRMEKEEKKKRVYASVYPSEFLGGISYREYNMKLDEVYRRKRVKEREKNTRHVNGKPSKLATTDRKDELG